MMKYATAPKWSDRMAPADQLGLTPLVWTHVAPYGEVRPNMSPGLSGRNRKFVGG
jgi:hypothetical protein